MILISQNSDMMISINDLKTVVFKCVEKDFEFFRDKNNIEKYRVISYEYQFIINDSIFAKYPDYQKDVAFQMRDDLIQSFLECKPIFQFVPTNKNEKMSDIV